MKIEASIKQKLTAKLNPLELFVENESHMHSVPENSETHFKVLIVAEVFRGLSRVERQQLIYSVLAEELKGGVHALSQRTYSPEEWEKEKNKVNFVSPQCLGGSKKNQ